MSSRLSIESGGETRFVPLVRRMLVLGGEGCDVHVPGCSGAAAHLTWDGRMGRLLLLGSNRPEEPVEEIEMETGRAVALGSARIRILPPGEEEAGSFPVAEAGAGEVALAALWVHGGRADPSLVRKWTEACVEARGRLDSVAAAEEILSGSGREVGGDELEEIAARALRNALLTGRKRRGRASMATKRAGAYLLARALVFVLYTATAGLFLVLLKRWTGFDLYAALEPLLPRG